MGEIVGLAAGVHHQEELAGFQRGDHQVVEDAAGLVGQQRVALPARLQAGDVAGHQRLQRRGGGGAGQRRLAHVGDVEQRRLGAAVQVLGQHAAAAALFDASHMGQATLTGATAAAALETLVPGDIAGLKPGRQRYTLLTNEAGGILDDLMVATLEPGKFFLVVNASRKADDFPHVAAALPAGVSLMPHPERALLALRGRSPPRCSAGSAPRRDLRHGRGLRPGARHPLPAVALRLHRGGRVRNLRPSAP